MIRIKVKNGHLLFRKYLLVLKQTLCKKEKKKFGYCKKESVKQANASWTRCFLLPS